MHGLVIALLLASLGGLTAEPAAAEEHCPRGWFGIRALVTRVSPPEAKVYKRAADGHSRLLRPGSVLCQRETLLLPNRYERTVVELYVAGQVISVDASMAPYTVRGGPRAVLSAAAAYVNAALEASTQLAAPRSRPQPTGAQGEDRSAIAFATQISPILYLRNLPRQFLTADANPVVAWNDSVGPYACQAVTGDGTVIWGQSGLNAVRCEFKAALDQAARLIVRDSRGRSAGWNVATVSWRDVPRPAWVPSDLSAMSSGDRTAWGIWIWQQGGPEWRLQSLGLLNAAATREWLASYVLDRVLAEEPPVIPW